MLRGEPSTCISSEVYWSVDPASAEVAATLLLSVVVVGASLEAAVLVVAVVSAGLSEKRKDQDFLTCLSTSRWADVRAFHPHANMGLHTTRTTMVRLAR